MIARHCYNRSCCGPEWWALGQLESERVKPCPACGYPCRVEVCPDELSPENVAAEIRLVQSNVNMVCRELLRLAGEDQ